MTTRALRARLARRGPEARSIWAHRTTAPAARVRRARFSGVPAPTRRCAAQFGSRPSFVLRARLLGVPACAVGPTRVRDADRFAGAPIRTPARYARRARP